MDFEPAFELLLKNEGVLSDDARDSGGLTKFGISKRSYPLEDIANLTKERAAAIYKRDFWQPAGCDALPDAIKFHVFDFAVNSGIKQAIRTLQKVVGETPDGLLGPHTLQAVQSMPADRLVARYSAARLKFMAGLTGWAAFGAGWANRIAHNLELI